MGNGSNALFRNTTGNYNVAEGLNALYSNTTGSSNIAIGINAGGDLTTGNNNIDIGNRGVAGGIQAGSALGQRARRTTPLSRELAE